MGKVNLLIYKDRDEYNKLYHNKSMARAHFAAYGIEGTGTGTKFFWVLKDRLNVNNYLATQETVDQKINELCDFYDK